MKAVDGRGLAIGIRERYRDIVSDRWPVAVIAQPDELLSSWVHRLALANGIAPRRFAGVLGLGNGMWSASLDMDLPADVATLLHARTGLSPQQQSALSLAQSPLKPLLLSLRSRKLRGSSCWLQFCSRCLAGDEEPYFRRQWRLASQVTCSKHGCGLRDRCPSCTSRIAVFDQTELVPQHFCVRYGFDLRQAPKVFVGAAARRLERCIDDICRLEAMTGSLTKSSLIYHLLAMPAVAGVYPTAASISLSTSSRIRCFERLAERRIDWLTIDDDVAAAYWRWSIMLAGGHGALIALVASRLERRGQRQLPTKRRLPAVKVSALLAAYVSIMERRA